jgi:separase
LTVITSPSLVANLWDVTDRDIDRLSEEVFKKLHLDASHVPDESSASPGLLPISNMSTVAAVNASRDACKLKYLTGAAPVVYGIPVYLH